MKTYFVHAKAFDADGSADSLCTFKVEAKNTPLPHHLHGLSYTASGYGKRIPTTTMVKFNGKWRRVYVCQFSNSGTAYIGEWTTGRGAELTVSECDYV